MATEPTEKDLAEALAHLRATRQGHLDLGKLILAKAMYPLDFLAVATLNRSLALLRGFAVLIESRNLMAAAPILRMQLDSVLRISAAWHVQDPQAFAMEMLRGTSVRRLSTSSGSRMTDRFLIEELEKKFPGVLELYDKTSSYVHLSDSHIFNAVRVKSEEGRTVEMKISDEDRFVPLRLYVEAVDSFGFVTDLLFSFLYSWGCVKAYEANHL